MRIGFDAKRAAQNRTGLGNYSRFIIRILSEQFSDNSYHLFVPKPHRMPYLSEIPTLNRLSLHFPPKGIWSKLRSIWRVWGMTKDIQAEGINLFHGLSNELPLNIGTPEAQSFTRKATMQICGNYPRPHLHTHPTILPLDRPQDIQLQVSPYLPMRRQGDSRERIYQAGNHTLLPHT